MPSIIANISPVFPNQILHVFALHTNARHVRPHNISIWIVHDVFVIDDGLEKALLVQTENYPAPLHVLRHPLASTSTCFPRQTPILHQGDLPAVLSDGGKGKPAGVHAQM